VADLDQGESPLPQRCSMRAKVRYPCNGVGVKFRYPRDGVGKSAKTPREGGDGRVQAGTGWHSCGPVTWPFAL
jgi:hypothetical protein